MKSATQREFGPLVDFGRRGDLDQAPMVHDADAVGDRHRLLLVVGDDDEGETELLLQLHQLELRFAPQLLVERRKRLVEQEDARPLHQRARERNALALTAGELVRLALAEAFEPHQLPASPRRGLRSRTWAAPPA